MIDREKLKTWLAEQEKFEKTLIQEQKGRVASIDKSQMIVASHAVLDFIKELKREFLNEA